VPQKLKDIYFTTESIAALTAALAAAYPPFDKSRFMDELYAAGWPRLELMDRMRRLTRVLHATLPTDLAQALDILKAVLPSVRGFEALSFPDYLATYGLEQWELSMPALAFFTRYASAEFAVREFIARDPARAMPYLQDWAQSDDMHVRRLASEGCRPRLPWGRALPVFQEDPSLILPVLEALKDDPQEYVRKSVANNLNAISKEHPDLVLDIAERWYGVSSKTDRIVKHACRTLLKAGNRRALRLFGTTEDRVAVEHLRAEPASVEIGGELAYSFDLRVEGTTPCQVRLELRVAYARSGGKTSRKVFRIAERTFDPGRHTVARRLSFADRSTRQHFPGAHRLTVVANGRDAASLTVDVHIPGGDRSGG